MTPTVVLDGISKRFGPVQALDNVSFTAKSGQIQAIVGENGAGKSTLMKVLYGAYRPDSGTITVENQPLAPGSQSEALRRGIGMVSQHYSIIPALTCLDNLILGAEPAAKLDRAAALIRAESLAQKMGFQFDWHARAETLSPAGAQKLEILKLLWRGSRVMILDEPTAMLSPQDSDALFESLTALAQEGNTIIVVTHRLPEVLLHCAEVTVLRGGKLIEAKPVTQTNADELTELIVGRPVHIPAPEDPNPGDTSLTLNAITVKGERGDDAIKNLSLTLRAGELIGIAGVDGNGQRELFQAILGVRPLAAGTISLGGKDISREPLRDRLQDGLTLIPEDRLHEGVIESWSITENAILGRQWEYAPKGTLNYTQAGENVLTLLKRFATKYGSTQQPIGTLSGGNQQRFVAARALSGNPKLILAFQPARGLDLAGIADVYAALRDECARGACGLVVSFDLDELLAHCHRVVALCHGELGTPRPGFERDRNEIGRLMVGVTA